MIYYASALVIKKLALNIHLGVTTDERVQRQRVEVDIRLYFRDPQECAGDDSVNDFVCYDEVCQAVRGYVENKEFRFMEYLAKELHGVIRGYLADKGVDSPEKVACWISTLKPQLPVDYEVAGARHVMSDIPLDAKLIEVS